MHVSTSLVSFSRTQITTPIHIIMTTEKSIDSDTDTDSEITDCEIKPSLGTHSYKMKISTEWKKT